MTRGDDSMGRGGGRGIVHGTVGFRCLGTVLVAELTADGWRVPDLPEPAEWLDAVASPSGGSDRMIRAISKVAEAPGAWGGARDRHAEGAPFPGIDRLNRMTEVYLRGTAAIPLLARARARHQADGRDAEVIRLRITVQSSPARIELGPMRPGAAHSSRGSAVIGDDPGPSGRPAPRMDTYESAGTTRPYGREADAITLDVVEPIASR